MGVIVKHIMVRVSILMLLMVISVPVGQSTLPSARRCGTGDILQIIAWFLLFYALWSIGLLIELFFLHKKGHISKRNCNLVLVLLPPVYQFFRWIFDIMINS